MTDKLKTTMSSLLNAIDGVMPAFGVIRFFSANDPNIISGNEALSSRFKRLLFFDKPNDFQKIEQIKRVYINNNLDNKLIKLFIEKISECNLNMRQITDYLCRFLDEEKPLEIAFDKLEIG